MALFIAKKSYPITAAMMLILFYTPVWSGGLQSSTASHPKASHPKARPMTAKACAYLVSTYIKKHSLPYCLTYGNPKTARMVLIVWTALTCPLCSQLYQGPLLKLQKRAEKNPDFALILRDYPTDPISLVGSAMVWSLGKKPVPEILHRLHVTHDWMNPLDKALDALEDLVKQSAVSKSDPKKIESARKNKSQHEQVFNSREADKNELGLTQVPWAIVLEKSIQKDHGHTKKPSNSVQKKANETKTTGVERSKTAPKTDPLIHDSDWTACVLGTPNQHLDEFIEIRLKKP